MVPGTPTHISKKHALYDAFRGSAGRRSRRKCLFPPTKTWILIARKYVFCRGFRELLMEPRAAGGTQSTYFPGRSAGIKRRRDDTRRRIPEAHKLLQIPSVQALLASARLHRHETCDTQGETSDLLGKNPGSREVFLHLGIFENARNVSKPLYFKCLIT